MRIATLQNDECKALVSFQLFLSESVIAAVLTLTCLSELKLHC